MQRQFARSLFCLAALSVAALSVQAADVKMYGIIDTGIIIENNKMGTGDSQTRAYEEFGINLGPRVGLRGTEDLGNGTKVKLLLENLFESDNGAMRFNRLFGRESSLALEGPYGEIAFGRMGALTSPFGHWGIFGLEATPFGFGWGRSGGVHWMVGGDRLDNTISYASPKFGPGVQLYAQYSFQTGTNPVPGVENAKERHNTRRASIAFRIKNESLTTVGTLDRIMNTHNSPADYGEDTTIGSLTVNFPVVKDVRLFVMGQYFRNVYNAPGTPVHSPVKLIGTANLGADNQTGISGRGFDGYVASINAQIKVAGGDLYLTTAYDDWEYKGHVTEGQETDLKRYLVGAAYEYPLSKHTHLYASANWTHGSGLFDTKNFSDSSDPNSSQVMAGITHFF